MKITDLKVHILDVDREFQLPLYGKFKAGMGVVRIFTDEGIEGNADYYTPGFDSGVLGNMIVAMKPHIVGEDPFSIEHIWERTFRTTRFLMPIYVPGCINVALWDIMGKALSTPVYRLMGGTGERIRAYASTQACEDLKSFVSLAESLVERGFTAIKLHSWADAERDIELCRVIRKTVGPKIDLMIDPIGMYDRYDALKVGRAIDELDFYWYEEPMPEADVEGYIELCKQLDVPVVGVDSLRLTLGNYADYIARGAFDIVQADAARQGISWTRKLAAIAEGFGRKFQAHAQGTPLYQVANLHLVAVIGKGGLFEVPAPEGLLDTAMVDGIVMADDGYVHMPERPGLGLEIDWPRMEKITMAVLT